MKINRKRIEIKLVGVHVVVKGKTSPGVFSPSPLKLSGRGLDVKKRSA